MLFRSDVSVAPGSHCPARAQARARCRPTGQEPAAGRAETRTRVGHADSVFGIVDDEKFRGGFDGGHELLGRFFHAAPIGDIERNGNELGELAGRVLQGDLADEHEVRKTEAVGPFEFLVQERLARGDNPEIEIGRASCRERV